MKEIKSAIVPYGETEIVLEHGMFARQANGSVTVRQGDTVLLATACVADKPKPGSDFFPLTVDYEERMYAAGKISSSKFMKREGRPSETAVLIGRLVDRSIRPMFPKGLRREIQVIITTLSFDGEHDTSALAVIGASAALIQTDAPFTGPVAAVRVGLIDGKLVLNPTASQLVTSQLDLLAAGSDQKIAMIEVAANEISESLMAEALVLAQKGIAAAIEPQKVFINADKEKVEHVEPEHINLVKEFAWDRLQMIVTEIDLEKRHDLLKALEADAIAKFAESFEEGQVIEAVELAFFKSIRALILDKKQRPDGRKMDEVRPITAQVGVLPRVHGSGLFNRGETQALTIVTLAGPGQEQHIDTLEEFGTKRYIHHYNFPPYATGEIKRMGGMNRREIGHGALAEKALELMIPDRATFPYTIRLVSEILGSNGSSSMAATCGSTLALMDAGVPIKSPVAGIAMGMVAASDDNFQVLTDLQGLEDFAGEMDFKIAGTTKGITAIQLDVKNQGLTAPMIEATFEAALKGREQIMAKMLEVISEPKSELSPFAPRIITTKIDPEKIGELIGPGGKVINKIIDDQGGREILNIDIDDDGTVMITSNDAAKAELVKAIVESIGKPVQIGEEFTGSIIAIQKDRLSGKEIGAIVQLTPNKDGMIHVSALGTGGFVEKVSDVVKVGDTVKVRVKDVDPDKGRISLVRID